MDRTAHVCRCLVLTVGMGYELDNRDGVSKLNTSIRQRLGYQHDKAEPDLVAMSCRGKRNVEVSSEGCAPDEHDRCKRMEAPESV